jgi:hypothetical protein
MDDTTCPYCDADTGVSAFDFELGAVSQCGNCYARIRAENHEFEDHEGMMNDSYQWWYTLPDEEVLAWLDGKKPL